MNEIGLDPGLDHVICHKVIHEEEKKGNKILRFESWCGALPAPETCNNPFSYKFSWSPKGALVAMNNPSFQLINGRTMSLLPHETILNTTNKIFHRSFNLEGYYNRDSRPYIKTYNLKHAHTVIRGTLRYKGTTFAITCLKYLGLYDDSPLSSTFKTWRDLFEDLLKINKDEKINLQFISQKDIVYEKEVMLSLNNQELNEDDKRFYFYLASYVMSRFDMNLIKFYGGYEAMFTQALQIFQFLDFHSKTNLLKGGMSKIDEISELLKSKLKMNPDDRDMDFMQNEFTILTKDGNIINRKLDLLVFGNHNNLGHSATALLVGTPTAIGAQMILDGKITQRGVLTPNSEEVINTVLSELEKMKIYVTEEATIRTKF